ncbi:hypothetical protein ACWFNE_19990 [Cellulomonas sp. NPDC055163]
MTREPETEDGTATPAARGLPDHLDLLAEPLRTPVREGDEPPGSVPLPGTAGTASRHGSSTGTDRTAGGVPTGDLRDAGHPGATNGGARTDTTREAQATTPPGATTDSAPRASDPTGGAAGDDRPVPPVDAPRPQGPTSSVPAPRPDTDAIRTLPPVSNEPSPTAGPGAPQPAHHGGGSHSGARPGAWTPPPHVAPAAPSARHRRQPWAVIVLAMLFALTLALATYLVVLTRAHEERAAQWEQVARTTGTELAQQRVELDGAIAELEAVRTQLQTAQARITELADEKAQIGDEREAQRQLVDYQARVSEAAGKVAGALDVCVDGQYQLISYLENAAAYDAADLARFRTDVQQVCGAARDANAALQLELER